MEGKRARKLVVPTHGGTKSTFIAYYPSYNPNNEKQTVELWRTYGAPSVVEEWTSNKNRPPPGGGKVKQEPLTPDSTQH